MAERIPFLPQQSTGLDELSGAGQEAINVIVEPSGSLRRRPGIAQWSNGLVDSDGIDGIHATVDGVVYALSATQPNRQLYKVSTSGSTALTGVGIIGTRRPMFAETESILVIVAGDTPFKMRFDTEETSLLGGSPSKASHTIAQSSRVLVNDVATTLTQVNFSAQALGSSFAGFEQWNGVGASGFFQAEARPDPVLAIAENTNEVFTWGSTTLQVFAPDPVFGFAPVSTREHGLAAPYSVIKTDQAFAYLDQHRRFVIGDGRSQEPVSAPIQRVIDEVSDVSSCYGYRVQIGPTDALCWNMPDMSQTFVYQKGSGWGQWHRWNETTNNFSDLGVLAATHNPVTNETLVALTDGRVGVFRTSQKTDFGTRIVSRVTTGFLNRKTDARKHCQMVRLALRRGETPGGTEPQAWLRWRDRPGAWDGEIPVQLGISPDTEIVLLFPSLGVYRRRQWQFEFSGTEDIVLTEASEDFEVVGD